MADFKLPVAPIFDGESFELDGDVIKGKDGVEPDDATIELNADGKLQIKDEGVSLEKMATIDTSHAGEFYKVGDDGRPTFGKVEPDNATIELNASDELQVKDRGITLEKMARQTSHVNEVYMTDNAGYPTLGEVMPKFRFDNTRETSEGLTIPDIDETTFQDICNFVNEGKPVIVEYDTLATPIKHTIFIGSKYDEWSASDCLAVSFIGDDLVRWFYDYDTGEITAKKIIKDVAVDVDDTTIEYNSDDKLQVKDDSITLDKLAHASASKGYFFRMDESNTPELFMMGKGVTVSSVTTSAVLITSKNEIAYHIGGNFYYLSGSYTLAPSAVINANTEYLLLDSLTIDGKRSNTYQLINGANAAVSQGLTAVVYPYGTKTQVYISSPYKITGSSGNPYIVLSGIIMMNV